MKNNIFWAAVLVIIFISLSQQNQVPKQSVTITATNATEIASLVDAGVSFTGVDKYLAGTSLSTESVRIYRFDGATSDLGYKSLNSGTLSVTPETKYRFYFFFNDTLPSSTHYVDIQDYTAKIQDSVDDIIGYGCKIDTAPIITVRDSSGNIQTASANAESIGAAATKYLEVEIKSHMDKCFGMPKSTKKNVACFGYSTTYFSLVKANTPFVSVPYSVSTQDPGTVSCYQFDLLEDTASTTLTMQLTSVANPTTANNISIYIDDIAFDLNQEDGSEIYDYTDEDGNQLGYTVSSTPISYIRVS